MDRETAVNQLIANKGAPWDEQDRDTLISMPDKTFEKVVAANTEPAGGDAGDGGDAAGEEARPRPSADKPAEQPQATAPASSAAASEISFADLLKRAPDDVREVLDEGVALRAARRKRLIDGLVGCERCKFTQPELEACTTRHLEHLADLAQLDQPSRHADYSGRAPATSQSRSPFKSAPKGVDWTNQAAI